MKRHTQKALDVLNGLYDIELRRRRKKERKKERKKPGEGAPNTSVRHIATV
jgi:hypothetical protein